MSPQTNDPATHPVQVKWRYQGEGARAPVCLTMRAYEVYAAVHGEQEAMITGGCRGGFGCAELLAFLYARSFPKAEWNARVDEALRGLTV